MRGKIGLARVKNDAEVNMSEIARATTAVTEAAKRLGIGRNQAYEAAARGDIPTIRIGKRILRLGRSGNG